MSGFSIFTTYCKILKLYPYLSRVQCSLLLKIEKIRARVMVGNKKNGSCSGYRFTLFKRWFIIGIVNLYKCIFFYIVFNNVWQWFGKFQKQKMQLSKNKRVAF